MRMANRARPERVLAVGVLLVLALLALTVAHFAGGSAQADDSGPTMSLSASGAGVSCDGGACDVPLSGEFTVTIQASGIPEDGYVGFQTDLYYGGLPYRPAALEEEIAWPESSLAVRFPVSPRGSEGNVQHGDVSSLVPPFPVSTHTGTLVSLAFACSAEDDAFTVAVLPYEADVRALGAGYKEPAAGGSAGDTVAVKTTGQAEIDVDGDTAPESTNVADALTINCAGEAPPPPPPTQETPTGGRDGGTTNGLPGVGTGGAGQGGAPSPALWALLAGLVVLGMSGLAVSGWRLVRIRQRR